MFGAWIRKIRRISLKGFGTIRRKIRHFNFLLHRLMFHDKKIEEILQENDVPLLHSAACKEFVKPSYPIRGYPGISHHKNLILAYPKTAFLSQLIPGYPWIFRYTSGYGRVSFFQMLAADSDPTSMTTIFQWMLGCIISRVGRERLDDT